MLTHWPFQGSEVCVATLLWEGRSGVRVPIEARDFSVLQNVQTSSRAHPVATRVFFLAVKWPGLEVYPCPSKLRMRGAMSLHTLSAFVNWTGRNFIFVAPVPFPPWGNALVKWIALSFWRRALYQMGFVAVTVVPQNICVFCDVVLCHWTRSYPHYEGLYYLYLYGYGVCGA